MARTKEATQYVSESNGFDVPNGNVFDSNNSADSTSYDVSNSTNELHKTKSTSFRIMVECSNIDSCEVAVFVGKTAVATYFYFKATGQLAEMTSREAIHKGIAKRAKSKKLGFTQISKTTSTDEDLLHLIASREVIEAKLNNFFGVQESVNQ